MSNLSALEVDSIKFDQRAATIAHPAQIYAEVMVPQTRLDKPRIYLPGSVTSGAAINIAEIATNIPRVIQENSLFATTFWDSLLNGQQSLALPDPKIDDIRSAQLLLPHALGKCVFPAPDGGAGERWAEYDYYVVWFSWILGIHPEMVAEFSQAMLAGVVLATVKDHSLPRAERRIETRKIVHNVSTYFVKNQPHLQPIQATISLPNPDRKSTQSLGTETEQEVVENMGVPSYDAVLHHEVAVTDPKYNALWQTMVGNWMLAELQKQDPTTNPLKQSVSFQLRD